MSKGTEQMSDEESASYYDRVYEVTVKQFRGTILLLVVQVVVLLTLAVTSMAWQSWTAFAITFVVSLWCGYFSFRSNLVERIYWLQQSSNVYRRIAGKLQDQVSELESQVMTMFLNRAGTRGTFSSDEKPKIARLIANLAQIEKLASELVDEDDDNGEGSVPSGRRSLFRIRSELRARNIWSDSDLVNFDNALRLRNAFVHGDVRGDLESLDVAVASSSELAKSLRATSQSEK